MPPPSPESHPPSCAVAPTRSLTDPIATGLRLLNQLAKKLKQRRIDAGALFLASPEVRFNLENESQDPVDVGPSPTSCENV